MRDVTIDFDAQAVIDAVNEGANEGARWAADLITVEARERAPKATSQLTESIQAGPVQGKFAEGNLTVIIGAGAPYAAYVEYGTGIWGPKGDWIWIEPVDALALRFPAPNGDGWAFSAGHYVPGAPAQPFMVPAVEEKGEEAADGIGSAIELALLRMGD